MPGLVGCRGVRATGFRVAGAGRTTGHALTWRAAWRMYEPKVPPAELAQRVPELAIDCDFTCSVIEDRIAFLARHAGRAMPE